MVKILINLFMQVHAVYMEAQKVKNLLQKKIKLNQYLFMQNLKLNVKIIFYLIKNLIILELY